MNVLRVFAIFLCFVSFLFLSFSLESDQIATPRCVSSSCCNYCNVTYDFPVNSCKVVIDALSQAARDTDNFEYIASVNNPASVQIEHTTISTCCPVGFPYHEDVFFNTTQPVNGTSCTGVEGISISRSGTCDLGNDQVNLQLLVEASKLLFTGPSIVNGCEID